MCVCMCKCARVWVCLWVFSGQNKHAAASICFAICHKLSHIGGVWPLKVSLWQKVCPVTEARVIKFHQQVEGLATTLGNSIVPAILFDNYTNQIIQRMKSFQDVPNKNKTTHSYIKSSRTSLNCATEKNRHAGSITANLHFWYNLYQFNNETNRMKNNNCDELPVLQLNLYISCQAQITNSDIILADSTMRMIPFSIRTSKQPESEQTYLFWALLCLVMYFESC